MKDLDKVLNIIPYSDLLTEAVKQTLSKEYANVKVLDADLSLQAYLKDKLTPEEVKAFQERTETAKAYDLAKEFSELDVIPEAYRVKDIRQTPTYKTLSAIEALIRDYQELALKDIDTSLKAKEYFVNLKDRLETLDQKFRITLIDKITPTDVNTAVWFHKKLTPTANVTEYTKRWKQLKNSLNSHLAEYRSGLTNQPIQEHKTINKEELGKYFKAQFKGFGGANINYLDMFVSHLETQLPISSKKDIGYIALLCYNGKNLNDHKPATFQEWYRIFCECLGVEHVKNYSKKNFVNPPDNIKNTFNYL